MKNFKNIKTGDMLLVSGRRWLSNQIQKFTDNKYNHIGIFYWCYDELFVIEMDRTGKGLLNLHAEIIMTPFKKYLEGDYDLLVRQPNIYIDGSELGALLIKDIGVKKFKYSYFDLIISQPILQWTGKWIGRKKIDNTLICSQYFGWRYNDYKGWFPDWFKMSPADFVKDKNFTDSIIIETGNINYKKIC